WPAGSFNYSVTPYTGATATYTITNSPSSYYTGSTPDDVNYTISGNTYNGLYLQEDWPNTTAYTTLTISLSQPVYGGYFIIYDIDAGGNSAPYTWQDEVTVSATDYLGRAISASNTTSQTSTFLTANTDNNNTNVISSASIQITGKKTSNALTATNNT